MLAKQWLKRGLRLQDRIRSLEESLAKAYDLATGTTASNTGDTVAHSGVSRKPEQYSILAEKVESEKRRLSGILAEITEAIAQVEDNTLATLLLDRYVLGMSFGQIAAELQYCEGYIRHLHTLAIEEIDKVLKESTKYHTISHRPVL